MDDLYAPILRSEKIWYREGTIVLQAENTQFRCYQGFLEKRSPAFKYLFSVPQPDRTAGRVDGCPVFRLLDRAQDVEWLLIALEDFRTYEELSSRNHAVVIGCLRLATKYAFGELRERIINNMLVDCPSTHDEWMTVRNSDRRDYWGPPRFFQLACLVCEQELPRVLLPTLIYDLCTFDVPSILDAFRASSQTMPMAIRETVLQIALVGREGFRTEKHEMIETLEERLPKCVRGDPACQKKHVLWFYSMHESIRYGDTDHELFFADISDTSTSPCRACNVRAEEILEELRDDSWQILPRSLNLLPPDEQRAKPPSAQHLDDDEFNALTGWDQLKYYQGVRVYPNISGRYFM